MTRGEKKLLVLCACLVLLVGTSAAWWRYINEPLGAIEQPQDLPSPNGYDYFVRADKAYVAPTKPTDPTVDTRLTPASLRAFKKRYPRADKEAWIRQNATTLRLLREGFKYRSVVHHSNSGPLVYVQFHDLARLLVVESKLHGERGEWDAAAQSALDAIELGTCSVRGGTIVDHIYSRSTTKIGERQLGAILDHLDAMAALKSARRLDKLQEQQVGLTDVLQAEKIGWQSEMHTMMADSGWRSAWAKDLEWRDRVRLYTMSSRTVQLNCQYYADALIAEAAKPYALRHAPPRASDPVTDLMAWYLKNSAWYDVRSKAAQRMLLIELGLRAFLMRNGRLPTSLSELAPQYLKQVPLDPFGRGEPLRYRADSKNYTLWSIGPDGVNDNGKPCDDPNVRNRHVVIEWSKGDIVAGVNR